MSDWISVDEAPCDGRLLLVGWWEEWPSRTWRCEVAAYSNLDTGRQGERFVHGRATHYQPLPEPPK